MSVILLIEPQDWDTAAAQVKQAGYSYTVILTNLPSWRKELDSMMSANPARKIVIYDINTVPYVVERYKNVRRPPLQNTVPEFSHFISPSEYIVGPSHIAILQHPKSLQVIILFGEHHEPTNHDCLKHTGM